MQKIEKPTIKVPSGEWRTADAPAVLVTGRDEAVYTCTALALHNPEIGVGYLAHYDRDSFDTAREMIATAVRETDNPKRLMAWAGGAALFELAEPEVLASRQRVADYLEAHGIPLASTCWLDSGHELTEVTLDCETSQVAAAIHSIYDDRYEND